MFRRPVSWIVIISFVFSLIGPYKLAQADALNLPAPGTMVNLSAAYVPAIARGITFDTRNPFRFNFVIDTGNSGLAVNSHELKEESNKLVKYFLTALTIPEDNLWVNLSP